MKRLIIASLFLLSPFISFASDICVSGFGASVDNGTYTVNGTSNGKSYYLNSSNKVICFYHYTGSGQDVWYINSDCQFNNQPSFGHYYNVCSSDTPDLCNQSNWLDNGGGGSIGTVTSGACSTEPEVNIEPFKVYATSTCSGDVCVNDVSPIVGNISFLLVIIITLLFLVVAGFLFNTLTDKARKPWKR